MKFKVGDKVTFKTKIKDDKIQQSGTVLEIQEEIGHKEKNNRYIRVFWDQDYEWSHYEKELELVQEPSEILKGIL